MKTNIKSHSKKLAAVLLAASLSFGVPSQSAQAGGIPVIDAVAIANMVQQLEQWKTNFKNMVRSTFERITGIKLSGEMDLTTVLEKRKTRCNQIKNSSSKQYCLEMIDLESEKIKKFQEAEKEVDSLFQKLDNLRKQHDSQITSGENAGKLQSMENEMAQILQTIQNRMSEFDMRVKVIDAKIAFDQKAREAIAAEQIRGSNSTLINAAAQAAVIATVEANSYRYAREADDLRKDSTNKSNERLKVSQ